MTSNRAETSEGQPKLPYYYEANGNLPPWFSADGKFDPYKFDAERPYEPKGETFELPQNPGFQIENPFDLRNLRIINPESVIAARDDLMRFDENLPTVCFIGTGGTIAMRKEGDTLLPKLDVGWLMEYAGHFLGREYQQTSLSFPTLIDSSQMKMDYDADTVIAMSYIWRTMDEDAKRRFDGFLITHGTDTLAPSSTRIQMMLGSNLEFNVGLVGAQVNPGEKGSDVGDNLVRALENLSELRKKHTPTIFLQMGSGGGGAYNPSGALKRSDTKLVAFESEAIDKIIDASDVTKFSPVTPFQDRYRMERSTMDDVFQPIPTRGFLVSKMIEAGMDQKPSEIGKMVEHFDSDITSLILRTYGSFTFDRQQYDAIMRAAGDKDMLVFAANPFPTGHSDHAYADTQYVIARGAIPLFMLPHAAEAKLKIARAIYGRNNQEAIKAFMTTNNYVGEQPKEWVPPLRGADFAVRSLGQPLESLSRKRPQPHDA